MSWLADTEGLLAILPPLAFCALLVVELGRPRRRPVGPPAPRWAGNAGLFLLNSILALWLLPPLLASFVPVPPGLSSDPLPGWLELLGGFLFLDLLSYALHRLFHTVPPLWRIHAVHHSDVDLDVTTALRHHPLEFAAIFVCNAVLAWTVGVAPQTIAIYGAFAVVLQMLQHGNVALPERLDRPARFLFATPAFHRLHHSRDAADHDANYGTVLSLWDRVFGTAREHSSAGEPAAYGIAGLDSARHQHLAGLLLIPKHDS